MVLILHTCSLLDRVRNCCLLRDSDTNADSDLDERLYAMQDGNWNVTGIIDDAAAVQERYAYAAYGQPMFLTPLFSERSASSYAWESLYCGYRFESSTGVFHVRNRVYHPVVGTWVQRDPISSHIVLTSMDGDYSYASSTPVKESDSYGLFPGNACKIVLLQFAQWFANDEAFGSEWLGELPDCPCLLPSHEETRYWSFACFSWGHHKVVVFDNPDPRVWTLPAKADQTFHPGAEYCMRSKEPTKSGAGQQCCNSKDGKLITHGPSAGTPDISAPIGVSGTAQHAKLDVEAFNWANTLDGACRGSSPPGAFLEMYLERRPPNKGKDSKGGSCAKNP